MIYIRAIKDMYGGAKTSGRTVGGDFFSVEMGLHQGSVLSPFLFALVMDELAGLFRDESRGVCYLRMTLIDETVNARLEVWRQALSPKGSRDEDVEMDVWAH
ncbi:hypothetical protein H5410_007114 [Solanum commersonii]|uniref:Reverse transcriptase domain-containing protein n=1 Tax=Solanum commersonii TaxID=4109 RepID=A0A9J6ABL1_SOLCO|nr:hypothetical protein H5410_007114 [Solanum commersonii]